MATRSKKPTSESKAIVKWDEELAKAAEIAAGMEANTGGGQFFSIKSGVLSWQDQPLPGNQMAVIILDSIFETVYYEGEYDPDTPQGPVAFAFGRDEKEMRWHENSRADFAGQLCSESEVCEWGSADRGKGKAARETRRLALIPAGTYDKHDNLKLFTEEDHYESTTIGFMKLPVTSVKGFASFVKQVAGTLRRPPFGIVTRVSVVPDAKTQFRVLFEPIEKVSDGLLPAIMKRVEEARATIDFPYQVSEEEPAPRGKKAAAGRGSKAAAVKPRGRKY